MTTPTACPYCGRMDIRNETARVEQNARHQARVDRARGVYGTGAIDKLDNEKAST